MASKLQTANQVINHLYANGNRYKLDLHDETWLQEQAIVNLFNIVERLETDQIEAPYLLQRLHAQVDRAGCTVEELLYAIKEALK
jgi:hypothetical protein